MKVAHSARGFAGLRPYLDVWIKGPAATYRLWMLVDSGADQTMVPLSVVRALGLHETGETTLGGVGGQLIGKVATAELQCAAGRWTGNIVGAPGMTNFPPVLGQQDFFRSFLVGFDGARSTFYVEHSTLK